MANRLPTSRDGAIIREAVTLAIRASVKSRDQIAEEMSGLAGVPVTVRQLNNYTAESRDECRFPIELTRVFCEVLQDWNLLEVITAGTGFHLANAEEQDLIRIGRAYVERARAAKQLREAVK